MQIEYCVNCHFAVKIPKKQIGTNWTCPVCGKKQA